MGRDGSHWRFFARREKTEALFVAGFDRHFVLLRRQYRRCVYLARERCAINGNDAINGTYRYTYLGEI